MRPTTISPKVASCSRMGRAAVNRSVRIVAKVMNDNQRMFLCAPLASARGPQRVRGQSARESCNGTFSPSTPPATSRVRLRWMTPSPPIIKALLQIIPAPAYARLPARHRLLRRCLVSFHQRLPGFPAAGWLKASGTWGWLGVQMSLSSPARFPTRIRAGTAEGLRQIFGQAVSRL